MELSKPTSSTGLDPVIVLGVLGIAGYIGYRYVYIPYKLKTELERQARARQAAVGGSYPDALAVVLSTGCQAAGASQGVPPQISSGICNKLAETVEQMPVALKVAGETFVDVGKPIFNTVKEVVLTPLKLITSVFRAHDQNPTETGCLQYRAQYSMSELYKTARRCMYPNEIAEQERIQGGVFTGDCITWRNQYTKLQLYQTAQRCMTQSEIEAVKLQYGYSGAQGK